jgi:hypothetical protein
MEGRKSPAERQFNVIFAYWKQNYPTAPDNEFNSFYEKAIEKNIEVYKAKLL